MEHCPGRERLELDTGSIEIVRDNNLERIYFKIPDVCKKLSPDSKKDLIWDVARYGFTFFCLLFVTYFPFFVVRTRPVRWRISIEGAPI